LLVFALCSTNANPEDITTKLAQTILQSRVFPSVRNESSANLVAAVLVKEFDNYIASIKSNPLRPVSLADFPCQLTGRSVPRPTNASKLLPGDIDFVASIGDSIAAAMGALSTSIFTIFTEYRGHAFSNGGQNTFANFVTVPAILKLYNPNVKGFSVGNGKAETANAVLNVAVSGARSYNLQAQLDMLASKMGSLGVTDNDWKLITIFVGGNDLCDYCTDTATNSPQNFQANLENALDTIRARFRRSFVNLVSPPDVTLLGEVSAGLCSILHGFECSCTDDAGTSAAHKAYIQKMVELAARPKYKEAEDFRVSFQPFLKDLVLPVGSDGKPDRSYFAPDCFHFSGKSHQAAAVALWNNMCESANKLTTWTPGEPLECPDELYLA